MGYEQCIKVNEQCLGEWIVTQKLFFIVFSNKFSVFSKISGIQTHPKSHQVRMVYIQAQDKITQVQGEKSEIQSDPLDCYSIPLDCCLIPLNQLKVAYQ